MVQLGRLIATLGMAAACAAELRVELFLPEAGQEVDCGCTGLDSNGNVIPDDAGTTGGCSGRGYTVTRNGVLKCVIVEDGTLTHDRASHFLDFCTLYGDCGWVGK